MDDLSSLGQLANHVLSEYIEVHDEIFGTSLWRTIQRTIPVPGLFQAIPYAAHAATLAGLRSELGGIRQRAGALHDSASSASARVRFLIELEHYCLALDDTISRLQQLCSALANKAEMARGLSWSEYNRSMKEYERSRQNYARLGVRLNEVFQSIRS